MTVSARRVLARFKAPRKGFPADLESIAIKWTAALESHGHDLRDWKDTGGKRYRSVCLRCEMHIHITPLARYGVLKEGDWCLFTERPVINKQEWKNHQCAPEVRQYVRGLLLVPSYLGGLELYTDEGLVEAALRKWMKGGVGSHWTSTDNAQVSRNFAMSNEPGLPVMLYADYWREDQRRNLKSNPHWQLVEFEYEHETQLGANEIVRLTAIEWFDGAKWIHRKLPDIKVKTGRV